MYIMQARLLGKKWRLFLQRKLSFIDMSVGNISEEQTLNH